MATAIVNRVAITLPFAKIRFVLFSISSPPRRRRRNPYSAVGGATQLPFFDKPPLRNAEVRAALDERHRSSTNYVAGCARSTGQRNRPVDQYLLPFRPVSVPEWKHRNVTAACFRHP